MKTALVTLLIVLFALLWLNPSMEDFRTFVEARSERILLRETGDTALGRALSGAGGALAGHFVDRITEHRNYFLFSTYTIDFDGADEDAEEWRFLGIAGRFVELDKPASLENEEAEARP